MALLLPRIDELRLGIDDKRRARRRAWHKTERVERHPGRQRRCATRPKTNSAPGLTVTVTGTGRAANRRERIDLRQRLAVDRDEYLAGIAGVLVEDGRQPSEVLPGAGDQTDQPEAGAFWRLTSSDARRSDRSRLQPASGAEKVTV